MFIGLVTDLLPAPPGGLRLPEHAFRVEFLRELGQRGADRVRWFLTQGLLFGLLKGFF